MTSSVDFLHFVWLWLDESWRIRTRHLEQFKKKLPLPKRKFKKIHFSLKIEIFLNFFDFFDFFIFFLFFFLYIFLLTLFSKAARKFVTHLRFPVRLTVFSRKSNSTCQTCQPNTSSIQKREREKRFSQRSERRETQKEKKEKLLQLPLYLRKKED